MSVMALSDRLLRKVRARTICQGLINLNGIAMPSKQGMDAE